MKRYIEYLKYVMRHKYFVMLECFKCGLIWRGIVHDLDKFFPASFTAYAKTFYNSDGSKAQVRDKTGYYVPTGRDSSFERAWFRHTRWNKHHWQYWILATESGEKVLPMDANSIIEMMCDWRGAGRAQGTPDTKGWWNANNNKMRLHEETRGIIEKYMNV